eukprot:comp21986_c0_seq1/m.31779 comp21986_c0_seq1/g.31779  ORF comp21986_c0_seq1/g.31779 comp21986_c0_seq1/m.31779 type:complete len:361 (-) comp21986_c0_seq1:82-1164(-)
MTAETKKDGASQAQKNNHSFCVPFQHSSNMTQDDLPVTAASEIDAEEAAQYDRQIRLWGIGAQQRMRTSKVLVAGLRTLAAEVCKNIVLAGLGAVTLLDHEAVSEDDLCGNFFYGQDDLGRNRAEASRERMQQLNPRVSIVTDTGNIAAKDDAFFKQFTAVCLTSCPPEVISRVDSICRAHGVKFFCGDNFGYFGYIFADLGEHNYVVEQEGAEGEATKVTQATSTYVSWDQAMSFDWSKVTPRALRMTSWLSFGIQGLQRFQAREGRLPHYGNKEDIESAVRDTGCVLTESGLAATLAPEESMRQLAQGACVGFSPVAAVVGGILGQEILKAVSAKDKPHNNFFFYDALTKSGTVETIG